MLTPNVNATWRPMAISPCTESYRLDFSDKYHLELAYRPLENLALIWICLSDGTVVHETKMEAHSPLHAQQQAGIEISSLLHNVVVECKEMESALTSSAWWRELASQNL